MKIVASVALLYGKDYLNHAIRSIIDDVQEVIVLYSATGSHGHTTPVPCPDTKDELYAIASQAAGEKLRWFDGNWRHEGEQRDSIYEIAPDADVIVVLDSDECYSPRLVNAAIEFGLKENVRQVRIPLVHMWRSFYRGFTHDPAAPTRLHFPKVKDGASTFTPPDDMRLWHYGYSQNVDIIHYKMQIHGHKAELRRDCDWFNDIFLPNRQFDCHPIGSEYWMTVEDIVPPDFMMDHPYANLDLIE